MEDDPNGSKRFLERHRFLSWLGFTLEDESEGRAVVGVPYSEKVTNPDSDVVHGGIVATLVDHAASAAIRTLLASSESFATTDLNVSYLRPATSDLRADAKIRRLGSSLVVVQVDVDGYRPDDEWKTVAVGRATFLVLE